MNEYEQQKERTVRDYIKVLFKHKLLIICTFVVCVMSLYVFLQLKVPVYTSEVKILVSDPKELSWIEYRQMPTYRNVQLALTQSEVVKSKPVLYRTIEALNLQDRPDDYIMEFSSPLRKRFVAVKRSIKEAFTNAYEFVKYSVLRFKRKGPGPELPPTLKALLLLKSNIDVKAIKETDLFVIHVKDYDPLAAAQIADVVSRSYVIYNLEQQLAELKTQYGSRHVAVNQLNDEIELLKTNIVVEDMLNVQAKSIGGGQGTVKIIDQASIPVDPEGIKPRTMYMIACGLGLFLGIILAFVFDYFDQTFRGPDDIERELAVPSLGSIPKARLRDSLKNDAGSSSPLSRAYSQVAEHIYLLAKNEKIRSMIIAPFEKQPSGDAVIAHLAQRLSADTGQKTLLIDTDFKGSSLHKHLEISETAPGLADILHDDKALTETVQTVEDNFHVLSTGQTDLNPLILLDSGSMAELLQDAESRYDLVLVKCADVCDNNDAKILSSHVKNIVLLMSEGRTRYQTARTVLANFQGTGSRVLGAVLTDRKYVLPKIVYDNV